MKELKVFHHPSFTDELTTFINDKCPGMADLEQTLNSAVILIRKQIYEKETVLTHKMFGLAPGFSSYPVYWIKLAILNSGLQKSQLPKCYLFANERFLGFLCFGTHIDNYKDAELKGTAKERLNELLEYFEKLGD